MSCRINCYKAAPYLEYDYCITVGLDGGQTKFPCIKDGCRHWQQNSGWPDATKYKVSAPDEKPVAGESARGYCDADAFVDDVGGGCALPGSVFRYCPRDPAKCEHWRLHDWVGVGVEAKTDGLLSEEDLDELADKLRDQVSDACKDFEKYNSLNEVLMSAFGQASSGKGKERHAADNRFDEQVICVVQRLLKDHPFGGHAFQAMKKTIEAGRLYKTVGPDAAYAEVLGAINYLAAMGILINEEQT